MNREYIYCDVRFGLRNHKIFLVTEKDGEQPKFTELGSSTIDELQEKIITFAFENGKIDIIISGAGEFAKGLASEIQQKYIEVKGE